MSSRRWSIKFRSLGIALIGALSWTPLKARGDELPAKIQAVVFKKILLYDRTISGTAKLLVVYGDEATEAEAMVRAFTAVGLESSAVKTAALGGSLSGVSAVYLCPHAVTSANKELLTRSKVLSLGGSAALAERGDVAVSLGTRDARAEIIVNLQLLRTEGHDLASDLLNLARVIR